MLTSIFWIEVLIATVVFGVMLYSVATFPIARNAMTVRRRRNVLVELVWTLIPIAIVVAATWPAVRMMQSPDVVIVAASDS